MRFADEERLLDAVRAARADGFAIVDAYTPYPVHGLDAAMGLPRSRLPLVAFGAGLAGVLFAIGFQFYIAAIDWPLNVGGKPLNSTLAYMPIAFEITVLLAGLAVTAAFLYRCRLFPGARPAAVDEAATLEGSCSCCARLAASTARSHRGGRPPSARRSADDAARDDGRAPARRGLAGRLPERRGRPRL